MSEIDNATLVESALEMQPLPQETASTAEVAVEAATSTVSNQEAMTALILGRVKKQSKQVEGITRLLTQVSAQFRNLEKRQLSQAKLLSRQLRAVQNQVRLVQKQVSRIKVRSAAPKKRRAAKKATKRKSRRR